MEQGKVRFIIRQDFDETKEKLLFKEFKEELCKIEEWSFFFILEQNIFFHIQILHKTLTRYIN